jgi:hypothetical protein
VASSGMLHRVAVRRLLVTASVVPSSPILVTLMKEALNSSETSVLRRATRHNIPGDAILHVCLWRNGHVKKLQYSMHPSHSTFRYVK